MDMDEKWFLVEVIGDEAFLRGYVEGYLSARGIDVGGVYFGSDYGLEDEGFLTRLEEFFGLKVEHNLLLMKGEHRAYLSEAFAKLPERWRLRVGTFREVREIRFPFKVREANREVAEKIKALLNSPPKGATIANLHVTERVVTEKIEQGLYTPAHPYEFKGEGQIEGEIEAVLRTYRALSEFEGVSFGEPEITFE